MIGNAAASEALREVRALKQKLANLDRQLALAGIGGGGSSITYADDPPSDTSQLWVDTNADQREVRTFDPSLALPASDPTAWVLVSRPPADDVSVRPSGLIVTTTDVQTALVKLEQGIDDLRDDFDGHHHGEFLTTSWTSPSYATAWSDASISGFENAAYAKDRNGIVRCRGLARKSAGSGSSAMFTLPEGHRPSANLIFSCYMSSAPNDFPCNLYVYASGVVSVGSFYNAGTAGVGAGTTVTWLSLSNIVFESA